MPKLLAMETTERIASLAAMSDGNLLQELKLDARQRSAQSLLPGVKKLLAEVGWRPHDIALVAVSIGPGSFTGLRIGVTAAKVFAYAARADVLGIDTLEAIAAGVPAEIGLLSTAVDAQRGDVAAGLFRRGPDGWFAPAGPQELLPAPEWLARLSPGTAVAGPVLQKLAGLVPAGLVIVDARCWAPTAAAVARLADRDYARGRRDDPWTLLPRYCRPSAAEEKFDARENPGP